MSRREFLGAVMAGAGAAAMAPLQAASETAGRPEYRGRRVVIVRFGGGVRRRESIDPKHTHAPFVSKELVRHGTLFPRMEIAQLAGLNTSHGEGTLNLLTGRYDKYEDIEKAFLKERFEPAAPTLFEYVRRKYYVQAHETLIVNGEDRPDEEFYTFSKHAGYGIDFRANVLSLYRFKRWLFERQIAEGGLAEKEREERRRQLAKWENSDPRGRGREGQGVEMDAFWTRWREHYGDSGLVNPRGDRLLTELAARALGELRPRLMMINYNDCDYVHWGYLSHYTRAIAIMDQGIRRLHEVVQADPEYRDNTVFVIVPDCGRDSNPMASVPCQHHFNSRSAHEIFSLWIGPGIARGSVVDRVVQQVDVPATIARLMGFAAVHAEGSVLEEVFA